ncbi:MAG TPA: lipoprotein [Geobacteraceae bacterium]
MKKLLLMVVVCFLAGCGKKGPLVPPESLASAPVADLRVEQQGDRFLVLWGRPAREAGGRPLKDLAGFRLFRREVLPPGEDCEECPTAYRLVASVDLEYPQGVTIQGDRVVFVDSDPEQGKRYRYKVVAVKRDGTPSRDSNRADRKKMAPPLPPVVKALSDPSGIGLAWQPVPAPATGRIEGYNVYRKRAGEGGYLSPLNGAPLKETVLEDTALERGVHYLYVVRTVAAVEGETVESDPSGEVEGALTEPE